MKKLMIVAALASSMVAFGACKEGSSGPDGYDAAVYAWKFSGKTTVGVLIKDKDTPAQCAEGTTGDTEVIRVPGTLAITGYSYICDDECKLINDNLGAITTFVSTKPVKFFITDKTLTIPVAHVIGKSKTQYELGGEFQAKIEAEQFKLTFAGLGTYNKKAYRFTSVSGNFAGWDNTAPFYNGKVNNQWCPPADYWDCETLTYAGQPTAQTVAYGTWSVKYHAAYSKKLAANKNWRAQTK